MTARFSTDRSNATLALPAEILPASPVDMAFRAFGAPSHVDGNAGSPRAA